MGSSETDTPTKEKKAPTVGPQEQPPAGSSSAVTPVVYPDWSGFQAYSPVPPPGFFHSSPQAHPYMWAPQHLMPSYGTPPPPYVMYPPGVYAHPSIPPGSHPFSAYAVPSPNGNDEASGAVTVGLEVDGKPSDGKEKSPIKRSKGSLGSMNMITGKSNNDLGKTSGASANGMSQSGESGSEGSSEGSDANSQNDSQPKTCGGQDSCDDASRNGTSALGSQNGVVHPSSQGMLNHPMPMMLMPAASVPAAVGGPTTALNIGMDYWGASSPSIPPVRGKVPATIVAGAILPGGHAGSRENIPSELWIQDERELKRQRRKQSNRESARRSRLRKQAECEELAQRVEVLKEENTALRAELERIRKEHDQLLAQNTTLKERLGGTPRETEGTRHERDGTQRPMDSNGLSGQRRTIQHATRVIVMIALIIYHMKIRNMFFAVRIKIRLRKQIESGFRFLEFGTQKLEHLKDRDMDSIGYGFLVSSWLDQKLILFGIRQVTKLLHRESSGRKRCQNFSSWLLVLSAHHRYLFKLQQVMLSDRERDHGKDFSKIPNETAHRDDK